MNNYIIYFLLPVALLLSSCNSQNEGISISLDIPSSKLNLAGDTNTKGDRYPYVPESVFNYLTEEAAKNSKIDIAVKAPGKKVKVTSITSGSFRSVGVKSNTSFFYEFETSLEEGKNRILLFKLGSKEFTEQSKDFNPEHLFLNGGLYDIKDGLIIDKLKLLPVFNFTGSFLAYEDESRINPPGLLTEEVKLKVYPSILKSNGSFDKIMEKTFDAGSFDISYIYNVFKKADNMPEGYSNLLVTASQDDKIGFTMVSKEFSELKSYDSDNPSDLEKSIIKDFDCYKYFSSTSSCENLVLDCKFGTTDFSDFISKLEKFNTCTFTQSGNLLPGVRLHNDIILYRKAYIDQNSSKPLVSSVSIPKFTKQAKHFKSDYETSGDDALIYMGNFFITGFNLTAINFNEKYNSGTIRISYNIPNDLRTKLTKLDSSITTMFIEYKGPFVLYRNQTESTNLKAYHGWTLQNRLPYFKIYFGGADSTKPEPFNSIYREDILKMFPEALKVTDVDRSPDNNDESFLGIQNLETIITSFEGASLNSIAFTPSFDSTKDDFTIIYGSED